MSFYWQSTVMSCLCHVLNELDLHGDGVDLGEPAALHVHHCVEKPRQAMEQVLLTCFDVEGVPASL